MYILLVKKGSLVRGSFGGSWLNCRAGLGHHPSRNTDRGVQCLGKSVAMKLSGAGKPTPSVYLYLYL